MWTQVGCQLTKKRVLSPRLANVTFYIKLLCSGRTFASIQLNSCVPFCFYRFRGTNAAPAEKAGDAIFNGNLLRRELYVSDLAFNCSALRCTTPNSTWSGFIFSGRSCLCYGISNGNTETVFKLDLSWKFSLSSFFFAMEKKESDCVWNALVVLFL